MKNKFAALALVVFGAMQPAWAQVSEKILVLEVPEVLLAYYRTSTLKLNFSGENLQDIELACLGEVYSEWFTAYELIAVNTPGFSPLKDLQHYEKAYITQVQIEADREIFNGFRPDVIETITSEIREGRQSGEWTRGPVRIQLDSIENAAYLEDLNLCTSASFVERIKNLTTK